MLRTQHNAWLHTIATVGVVALGFAVRLSRVEWMAVVFAMISVWVAEAFNTACELIVDLACPDIHPIAGSAKDMAAGAVLLAAIGAVVIGVLVFAPHLARAL
jgi:diacylglycerol kinase (ATP)